MSLLSAHYLPSTFHDVEKQCFEVAVRARIAAECNSTFIAGEAFNPNNGEPYARGLQALAKIVLGEEYGPTCLLVTSQQQLPSDVARQSHRFLTGLGLRVDEVVKPSRTYAEDPSGAYSGLRIVKTFFDRVVLLRAVRRDDPKAPVRSIAYWGLCRHQERTAT